MAAPTYRRVYIEVVTREDLTTSLSIDNLMFALCEHLEHRTAVVQLHIVDVSDSLVRISGGRDLIPETSRIAVQTVPPGRDLNHMTCLHLACAALNFGQAPTA